MRVKNKEVLSTGELFGLQVYRNRKSHIFHHSHRGGFESFNGSVMCSESGGSNLVNHPKFKAHCFFYEKS
jgi:hypothetical protein